MAKAVLEDQQRLLLQQERQIANELQVCLADFEEASSYAATLRQAITSLDDLFLLVVVGEFNAGKSACINALLHNDVLEEGVIPTTQQVTILRYGEHTQPQQREQNIQEIKYLADFLYDISVVDTPGVNAILLKHQQLTEEFVPRSDLILFVTSIDRPFTESERAFLERIRAWGKKVIIILNKIDLLRKPEELNQIMTFVQENCKRLLGFQPDIFPVSALQAQQARTVTGHQAIEQWEHSHFGALEDYLFRTLDKAERIRLKLLNPLGVMQRVLTETQSALEQRARLLAEDARTISTIDQQLRLFYEDMELNFRPRLNSIENIIIEMRVRGNLFLDDTIRLARLFDLLQSERICSTFEQEVLADSDTRIERSVEEIIDWLVGQENRLWQNVMEYVNHRRQASVRREDHMVGSLGRQFDYNRRTLLQSVAQTVDDVIQTYDPQTKTAKLAQHLRNTAAQMAIVSVSGVGLGTLTVVLLNTLAADVTGLIVGAVLLGLGIGILPMRRRRARHNFEVEMEKLRVRLNNAISEQFRKELNNSVNRIQDAIAPYTRFVRAEQQKTAVLQEGLAQLNGTMQGLKSQIEALEG